MQRFFRAIRKHRVVTAVAAVFVIGALALSASFLSRERWFTYLTGDLSTRADAELTKQGGWKNQTVDVGEGLSLRVLVKREESRNRPVVIFFPGNAAEPLAVGKMFLDGLLQDDALDAVACSYRGFAGNPGSPTPELLEKDAWKIYEALARERPERPIHLIGHSLGASVLGGLLAHELSRAPASVTLLSAAPDVIMRAHRFAWEHRYDALERLKPLPYPMLVIHGELDTTLPLAGGRAVASRLGARFVMIPGGRHNELLEAPEALSEIRRFITAHPE